MGLTEFIAAYATHLIAQGGYLMVALLMAMGSTITPVPSEAVLPFAGFLIYEGKFTFVGAVVASTVGSLLGSLFSYALGYYGGRSFVLRFGKYLLLDVHHLEAAERFFGRRGEKTIFISRFIPVIRHVISIPAGLGKMNLMKFSLYTILGSACFNAALIWVGFKLKTRWDEVMKYSRTADLIIIAAILAAIAYLIYKGWNRRKAKNRA